MVIYKYCNNLLSVDLKKCPCLVFSEEKKACFGPYPSESTKRNSVLLSAAVTAFPLQAISRLLAILFPRLKPLHILMQGLICLL